jgi:hypothetical protein
VPGQPLFGGIAVHATGLVCLPLCVSFIEGRGGMFPGEQKLKRLFRGLQAVKTKRLLIRLGLFAEVD